MKKLFSLIVAIFVSMITSFASDMRFVQVDGVRFSPDDTARVKMFENLVKDINKQKDVDFVVFSGNNIAKANQEYLKAFVKQAKKLNSPFYVILGNKDVDKRKGLGKVAYLKTLRNHTWSHKKIKSPNYVFNKNGVVFIVADGSKEVIPLSSGYYRPETINWIDKELTRYSKKNVVILQHFPIIPPAEKEAYYTFKAEDYLEMLENHKNVKALIAGHFDVNKEESIKGIMHISTAEAPKYRIIDIIDYDTDNPTFWSTLR